MDTLREQFSRIYDQYIEKIYRFVYLKVDSQETAEDIPSKVFLKVWELHQRPQGLIQNMNAFLYQIARNMVVDSYREKDRTKTVSAEFAGQIVDSKINLYEKAVLSESI